MDSSFPNVRAFRAIKSTPEAPSLTITFIKLKTSLYKNLIVNIRYTLKSGLFEPNIKFLRFRPLEFLSLRKTHIRIGRVPSSEVGKWTGVRKMDRVGPKLTMDPIGQDMSAHF